MDKSTNRVMRGEIYYYDFGNNEGSIQNGIRPALVVQCEEGNKASTTTVVAAITAVIKKRYLPSHIILGERFGLKQPSMVMLEQLRTVNQSDLRHYVGYVDDPYIMRLIGNGIKKALGLWVYSSDDEKNVRCLCPRCLADYKNHPDYIVRPLNPFQSEKHRCEKCDGYGYDYIVTERGHHTKGGMDNV